MTVTRNQVRRRLEEGGLAKFEAMLATGLSLETVSEIAVREGVAESTEEAVRLLSSVSDERTDRRGAVHRRLRDDSLLEDSSSSSSRNKTDDHDEGEREDASSSRKKDVSPEKKDVSLEAVEDDDEEDWFAAPPPPPPEVQDEVAPNAIVEQADVFSSQQEGPPPPRDVVSPSEDPQNFFAALLQETTKSSSSVEERTMDARRSADAAFSSSSSTTKGDGSGAAAEEEAKKEHEAPPYVEVRDFQQRRRRRRSTSAPPPCTEKTEPQLKDTSGAFVPPASPPLAEKLLKLQNEVPSRFKSEKRLKTEVKRSRSAKPMSLTVPESPALATKRRTAETARRRRDTEATSADLALEESATSFFKALALNPKIMRSSGDYGVPRVTSAPTTSPRPFAFATDARRSSILQTARKPLGPSTDDVELAKAPTTRKKIANVSKRLLEAMACREEVVPEPPPPKKAPRTTTKKGPPFRPTPSSKPLTKPNAPKMPGLEIHAAARAKLLEAQALATQGASHHRKPLAAVATNELNSDRRARDRRAYDLAVLERQKLRDADKAAADAAVDKAQHADLARKKRTSIAHGGLQFVAHKPRHSSRNSTAFIK